MDNITTNITNYLNNIKINIKSKIFSNLDNIEYNLLYGYYTNLIIYIYIHIFYPNTIDNYIKQLELNNNRDLYAILNLLLPMIDDKNGTYILHKKISNLKDISILKTKNEYEITKIQYDRFYLSKDKNEYDEDIEKILDKKCKEYEYNINDIEHNYKLLLDTIDIISNKLYINWNNIIPILKTEYKQLELYKKSFNYDWKENKYICETINNEKIDVKEYYKSYENINKYRLQYNGLHFMNYYNTIYYDLYLSIIDIKWLLYELYIINENENIINNKPKSYLQYINENINLYNIYNNDNWFLLDEKNQLDFEFQFNKFINDNIDDQIKFKIIFIFIFNFEKLKYKDILINEYNYFSYIDHIFKIIKKLNDDDLIKIFMNDEDLNLDEILKQDKEIQKKFKLEIQKIPMYMIYQYISSLLYKLDRTWYGKHIINKNDNKNFILNDIPLYNNITEITNDNYDEILNIINNKQYIYNNKFTINNFDNKKNLTYHISFKNIYNFAKSISLHYANSSNIYSTGELVGDWYNLDINKLNYHINYIFNPNISLISIRNYIKYTYIYSYDISKKLESENNSYYYYYYNFFRSYILSSLKDIVFECLIFRGLLSKFNYHNELTNNNYKNNYFNNMKKLYTDDYIKSIKKNSYYYLTDKLYNELNYVDIDYDNKYNNKTFFDLIKTKYSWTRFYALDWISQISFYHHYINNRMVMITGATGVGKSTQVPKLYLYSLKMIDHNYNGKIACSVPRIMPVRNNAERISWELGVPIFHKSKHYNEIITTNNGYIQYKTGEDSHIINNNDYYLRLITDGSLLQEVYNSPLLKNINVNSLYKANKGNEYNSMTKTNIYDIIIIDEAHEHNKNIDLLFTTLRYSIEYNNSLRLSIVSATMEDDEKLYRSYYNMINDNLLYPLNEQLKERQLDRITVDRRIHISPPGETTQFNIIEKYYDYEPENYDKAEEIALSILQNEILNKNIISDILIFSITEKKIINLVNKINNEILLPSSKFICIPCYSALNEYWKNFITNISKELKNLDIDRNDLMKYILNKNFEYKKVQSGYYTNVIIVATNIAEASLTFDTVKYVIDTGYYINVNSGCGLQSTIVNIDKISDASRKQRKGRVGRVSDGNVYYTYKENSRIGNKPNYGICSSDISDDIYRLLVNSDTEERLIDINIHSDFIQQYNIKNNILIDNKNNIWDNNYFITFNTKNKKYSGYIHQYIILDLLYNNKQLIINKKCYNYHGNKIFLKDRRINNDYQLNMIPERKITGYNVETILDINGLFYFIHPDEQSFIRYTLQLINIMSTQKNEYFVDRIYQCIIKNIKNNYLLSINNNFTKYNLIKNYFSKRNNDNKIKFNNNVIRSNYSYILDDVFSNNNIKLLNIKNYKSLIITLSYSIKYNCHYICIIMIILLYISNYNPINLMNDIYNKYNNFDDLFIYFDIASKIYNELLNHKILKKYENCNQNHICELHSYNYKNKCINKCDNFNDIVDVFNCKSNCKNDYISLFNKCNNKDFKKCMINDYFINNRFSYDIKKNQFIEIYKNKNINKDNDLTLDEFHIFKNIFDNQLFDNDKDYLKYISKFINNNNIKKILYDILSSLNILPINDFINNYNLLISIINLEHNNYFNWFKNNIIVIPTNNTYDSIKYSFLYGFNNIISHFDNKSFILDFDDLLLYNIKINNNNDFYKYNEYNIALDINNDNDELECNCLFKVNINEILLTKFLDFNKYKYINKLQLLKELYPKNDNIYYSIFNDIIKNYDYMKYKFYIDTINYDDNNITDIYEKSNDIYYYLSLLLNNKSNMDGGMIHNNHQIYKIKLSSLSKIKKDLSLYNIQIYKINYPYIYLKHK